MKKYFVILVVVVATTTGILAQYQVAISPVKMNILYIGVDNPVTIAISGVSDAEKVSATISQGTLIKVAGGEYIAKPATTDVAKISVFAEIDGQKKAMGDMEFRVKLLPVPEARIFGKSGGSIEKDVLLAQPGISAYMGDFLFDLRYTVTQFTIVVSTPQDGEKSLASNTAAFTAEQKNLFASLYKGTKVSFTNIKARGPDGVKDLRDLVFTVN